jgi:hypothetical protein
MCTIVAAHANEREIRTWNAPNKFQYYLNSCFARGYDCTVVRPIDETGEGCGPKKEFSMWHEMKKAVAKIDH